MAAVFPVSGLNSVNAMPGNGMSGFADAGYDPAFDPTGHTPLSISAWFKGNPVDGRFQNIVGHSNSSWRIALDGTTGKLHFNAGAGGEDYVSERSTMTATGIKSVERL